MGREIERKFLVTSMEWLGEVGAEAITQGYLSLHPERAVRVRVQNGLATLCIKGQQTSRIRHEFEYEIPLTDAESMLHQLCLQPLIQKKRHTTEYHGHVWEIDVFEGENKGLVVAEVELTSPDETISIPPWAGKEVTNDNRYLNINLVQHPYREWEDEVRPDPST